MQRGGLGSDFNNFAAVATSFVTELSRYFIRQRGLRMPVIKRLVTSNVAKGDRLHRRADRHYPLPLITQVDP